MLHCRKGRSMWSTEKKNYVTKTK